VIRAAVSAVMVPGVITGRIRIRKRRAMLPFSAPAEREAEGLSPTAVTRLSPAGAELPSEIAMHKKGLPRTWTIIGISLPVEVRTMLDDEAKRLGICRSELVRALIIAQRSRRG
jgi:hypothetical protein